ncbi:RabGAP/TBC [Rhizophagus irregularis]|uniref:RabGAP/TBC n=1 Tax=Rhizophagus irregularis TaxID=588596 RepID=A0A2I1GSC4_9GLOM|nr:RabGAP/TBC [Rhizophagus irregularis]PKY49548.1 RabGAP/TBC [Rhizophagus irregularis]
MSTSINEFNDILNAEVHIDLDKLRESSRHGVPMEIRGDVWKYLLGVNPADRSQELTSVKIKSEEYNAIEKEYIEINKRIRGEVGRYQKIKNLDDTNGYKQIFENVIGAYLNHNRDVDYHPALVHLCAPFVYCMKNEYEVYYCFTRLMSTLEEEVDINEWASSWLQNLFAKELQFENLLRLWDTYFSIDDPIGFHPYVCLAVLKNARENLEDLEQSEIRTSLLNLPLMDMEQIINQAFNIHHEILEKQISDSL